MGRSRNRGPLGDERGSLCCCYRWSGLRIRQPRSPRVTVPIADASAGGLLLTYSTLHAGALGPEWNSTASCDVDELQRLRGARVQSVGSPSAGTSARLMGHREVTGSDRDLVRSAHQPHGAHAQTQTRARRGTIAGLRWPSSSRRYGWLERGAGQGPDTRWSLAPRAHVAFFSDALLRGRVGQRWRSVACCCMTAWAACWRRVALCRGWKAPGMSGRASVWRFCYTGTNQRATGSLNRVFACTIWKIADMRWR